MEALWLKGHGLAHAQIAELVGVTENTITAFRAIGMASFLGLTSAISTFSPASN
jgi:L-serine deaminase